MICKSLTPGFYRRFVPGFPGTDTPQVIIAELGQSLGCRTTNLCGGNWQNVQHKHGNIIIGHLKVTQDLANKMLSVSGRRALFFTTVSREAKGPVAWLPKAKDCSVEEYYKIAVAKAGEKLAPTKHRYQGCFLAILRHGRPVCVHHHPPKTWPIQKNIYGMVETTQQKT